MRQARDVHLIAPSRPAPDRTPTGAAVRPRNDWRQRRHLAQGFTVLAVSLDTVGAPAVAAFVREHGLTFPIGLDARWDVARAYGVRALPTTALLDRQGRTVGTAVGPREWDGPGGAGLVAALLAIP